MHPKYHFEHITGPFSGVFMILTAILLSGLLLIMGSTTAYADWKAPMFLDVRNDKTRSIALGDMDGDGSLDVVVGNEEQPSIIYFNDGQGTFKRSFSLSEVRSTRSIAVGDINGDGFLDIVIGNFNQPNIVYLNDGSGRFNINFSLTGSYPTQGIALGDIDRDGALDIVAGNNGQPSVIFRNLDNWGTNVTQYFDNGSFLPSSTYTKTESIALGDVNGDESIDIVTGNCEQPIVVYPNDGAGHFRKAIVQARPLPIQSIALGDVNGDSALDIVTGNVLFEPNIVYLNRNDKSGIFDEGPGLEGTSDTKSIALGDINGNGALDAVFGNFDFSGIGFTQRNVVYFNRNIGTGAFSEGIIVHDTSLKTTSVKLGDLNGDGALDLVVGNYEQPNIIYLNDGIGGFNSGRSLPGESYQTISIALGDLNRDNSLDIVSGNGIFQDEPNIIYLNNGSGQFDSGTPLNGTHQTGCIAIGDINGDHALDIVSGNGVTQDEPDLVYLNDGLGHFGDGTPLSGSYETRGCALGDLNGDNLLDVVMGNGVSKEQPSIVYLNNGVGHFDNGIPLTGIHQTISVALGDLNGDGSLDIVAGNENKPSIVYLNDGLGHFDQGTNLASAHQTQSVAIGDVNADGAPDIVLGNFEQPSLVYLNDGTGHFNRSITLSDLYPTQSVVLGDMNGDGSLDIVAGNLNQPSIVYLNLNDGTGRFNKGTALSDSNTISSFSIALGDTNGDGSLDIVIGNNTQPIIIHQNMYHALNLLPTGRFMPIAVPDNPFRLAVNRPISTGNANFYSAPEILEMTNIPIAYTLFDQESDPIGHIGIQYSLDGGGLWYTAIPTITTPISNLTTLPYPVGSQHIFNWDTFASGFFGQSDNVVLRFLAYSQGKTPALPGTYRYKDTVAGSYQWPYTAATTFSFRARGTQIQVYTDTISTGNEVAGALVYRLQKEQTQDAILMGDEFGLFTTDRNGYLRGRGQLEQGDQLIALLPITSTEAYTVYYTNITPTINGLTAFTVTVPGVQKLVVSPSQPLILFNLKVALEWDARKDTTYLEQLKFDLQRTSELLFDLTNGQAALGNVTLYYNKEQWDQADIRIYATNDLRPHATIGGVLRKPRLERFPNGTVHLFGRGHVEIGAVWNRYGNAGERLSEDWARTLTHELGHYLFFLHDNYIGLQDDRLIRVDGCPGVMGDPYLDSDSEFHPDTNWLLSPCEQTFSHQVLGQSDWATIRHFYPWLNIPTVPIADPSITGPNLLPLAVTRIITTTPVGQAETIEVPSFDLTKESGGRYVANSSARAFLLQGNRLVSLGAPRQDRVQAWNARPGDQLCVYDLAVQPPLTGCEKISKGDQGLTLHSRAGWQPEVVVTPITSRTISITVNISKSIVSALSARIYPQTPLTDALSAVPLQPVANGFAGIITLTQPAFVADVHIFDSEQDPKLAALAEYTLGGAPTLQLAINDTLQLSNGDIVKLFSDHTLQLSNGGTLQLSNGDTLQLSNGGTLIMKLEGLTLQLSNGGVLMHPDGRPEPFGGGTLILSNGDTLQLSNGGTLQLSNGNTLVVEEGETLMLSNGDAPIRSNDGQITLFGEPTNTPPGQFYTLQSATKLPGSPTYATLVGRAYRLSASSAMSTSNNLAGASISFNYLGRDIDADKEHLLKIYFWDGAAWYRLDDTIIDEYHNIASAVVPDKHNGLGIYALLYSTEIPLNGPGWNSFAFVGPNGQSVPDGLASINGLYKIVWGYEPKPGPSDLRHWQAHDPSIPPTNKFYEWVNNLKFLTYGRGYWLNVSATGNITLYLKSSTGTVIASAATPETVGTTTSPPAVYYGEVWPTEDFTPLPGMTVTAWVDGQLCGQTQTRDLQGTVAYVLYIPAVGDSEYPNCGAVRRKVTFKVNDVPMLLNVGWDNTTIRLAPLFNRWVNPIFMPIITR